MKYLLLLGNIFVTKTCPQMEQNRQFSSYLRVLMNVYLLIGAAGGAHEDETI